MNFGYYMFVQVLISGLRRHYDLQLVFPAFKYVKNWFLDEQKFCKNSGFWDVYILF